MTTILCFSFINKQNYRIHINNQLYHCPNLEKKNFGNQYVIAALVQTVFGICLKFNNQS